MFLSLLGVCVETWISCIRRLAPQIGLEAISTLVRVKDTPRFCSVSGISEESGVALLGGTCEYLRASLGIIVVVEGGIMPQGDTKLGCSYYT